PALKQQGNTPQQLLDQVRRDLAALAKLRQEWTADTLASDLQAAKQSPSYHEQFRKYYEKQEKASPKSIPYTFDQYIELEKVRPQGALAFGQAMEKIKPSTGGEADAGLRTDFEAAKEHELFQEGWSTNSLTKLIR